MVFHWNLNNSESPRVFRNLLSILVVFNNVVVCIVSTRSPTSKFSSPLDNLLVTEWKAPITIGIIVTFMFHNSFNTPTRSRYLSFPSTSFSSTLWSAGTANRQSSKFSFFCWLSQGLILQLRLGDPLLCQSPMGDCVIIIIIIIIYSFKVFHISVNWWFYTGVWVTASLQDSSQDSGRS